MHTCPPPIAALKKWLKEYPSAKGDYGHLLLDQHGPSDKALIDSLRPYFESAHLDARQHFHAQLGINLHPDADGNQNVVSYPTCLPSRTLRGLFGEVLAGLVTQAYQTSFVGGHTWSVPIFLFREHSDVERYLWTLKYDATRKREVYGRHGTDFIGLSLSKSGEVTRIIAGEAKWRKTLSSSVVKVLMRGKKVKAKGATVSKHNERGIWFEVNRDPAIPHGLRQLQRLLELNDPNGFARTILSIDQAIAGSATALPRTNLILIAGNGNQTRQKRMPFINWSKKPKRYKAPHDLQIVEIILDDDDGLIEKLYSLLWTGTKDAGA